MIIEKPDYGKKHVCFKCGCKFYDLHKPEAICPKCNVNQKNKPATQTKSTTRASHHIPNSSLKKIAKKSKIEKEAIDLDEDDEEIPILDALVTPEEEEEEEY